MTLADAQNDDDVNGSPVDSDGAGAHAIERSPADMAAVEAAIQQLRNGLDLRSRKTRRLRGAIRAGVYENDLKLSVAIDRMLEGL